MDYVLFDVGQRPSLTTEEKQELSYLQSRLEKAQALGLDAQANLLQREIITLSRGALIDAPALTEDEIIIWKAFLPMTYNDLENQRNDWFIRRISDYTFDSIPTPVLGRWKQHKDADAFERYEIWTTERHLWGRDSKEWPDPVLVGVNGNAYHLLTRWGDEDSNLLSFDDIKKELKRRFIKNEYYHGASNEDRAGDLMNLGFLSLMCLGTVGALAALYLGTKYHSVSVGFVTAIGSVVGWLLLKREVRRRFFKHEWKSDRVMQAISRHDGL